MAIMRRYTTSYQSAVVSRPIALSCVIFEIFDVEEYRDLLLGDSNSFNNVGASKAG